MTCDLMITGGLIYDGTGNDPYYGDIAIKDGLIVDIGRMTAKARRTIDADGSMVTPGFVDIHTHYDGQVCWDETVAPSSCHGVTTAVMGNCGVGFAPLRPGAQDILIALMEGVEEIPGVALSEGVPWTWESFGDYMDSVAAIPHSIDLAAQVAHDPLRLYVMGARGAAGEVATEDDIRHMQALALDALRAGAVGISTGRTSVHKMTDGTDTPARHSTLPELLGLAAALKKTGRGVMQLVSDFRLDDGESAFDAEFSLVDAMAMTCERPLSLTLNQRDMAPKQWRAILGRVEEANRRGLDMKVQVAARGIGVFFGLETTLNPLMGYESYREIMHLPLSERVRLLQDPVLKKRILSEPRRNLSGDGSAIPPLADMVLDRLDFFSLRMFVLGESLDYEPPMEQSLYYVARERGVPVLEVIYETMLEQDGTRLIYFPIYNYSRFDFSDLQTMMTHPHALFGLSDGGAHVGTVCDAGFPTFLLAHWGRDRKRGPGLPLPWLIRKQTADNARHMGFDDRGILSVGRRADINVIDHANLALEQPTIRRDLPAGGKRLYQGARGYLATLVAGEPIVLDDELTHSRPGRLIR